MRRQQIVTLCKRAYSNIQLAYADHRMPPEVLDAWDDLSAIITAHDPDWKTVADTELDDTTGMTADERAWIG